MLEARNAGKPISDARGEMGMVVETFRYYAGAPERLHGKTIPVAGGVDMTFREPLGVVGPDHALELPADDRLLEGRAGAGRRQHDRAEAGRADPADGARAGEDRPRRPASPRACSTSVAGPGVRLRQAARRAPRRGQDRLHRLDRGRPRDRRRRRRDDQARHARAGRQVGQRDLRRRRPRGGRRLRPARGLRQRRAGLLRALADPGRALGDGRLHVGARGRGQVDEGRRSARRVDADGPADLGRPAASTVASYVNGDAPVAFRGSAPDGPGYWFPPTVLAPVSNDDRAAREEIFGPVACVIPFEGRGGGGRGSPTTRSTGSRARSGPATAPRPCASRGRSRPAWSRSTRTPRSGSRPRSAASSSRGSGASSVPTRSTHYTEVKNVYYATEGLSARSAGRQGLRDHRRGERHRRGDGAAVRRGGRTRGRSRSRRRAPRAS